ncbi:hypothetical protein WJX79_010452 [Trebouxia sp. C0005]
MDPERWLNAGLQQLLACVLTFAQSTLARVGRRTARSPLPYRPLEPIDSSQIKHKATRGRSFSQQLNVTSSSLAV